ncbi:MAG: M48 family metallopeptidase [Alphaproteobacteria bacterium]|uniref:M48 family metallopeptidase n=1 Tax=Candidatus Nitrobium versatile TaxID=2884831 RepID=A0A953LY25_9BACT|nr:M48 family metallopeptidase [Candidatus Nitrobium versatile]
MRRCLPFLLLSVALLFACQTVPITGRQQLSLVSSESLLPMSFSTYREFLAKHRVIENTPQAQSVKTVGARIRQAVQEYLSSQGLSERLKGYQWEFNLIEDKSVNAWAMPGGKVVVYSGMLPVAQNDTGLAVVMGHEIAHAVAAHGEERMSQGLIAQLGGVALSTALSQKPQETVNLFMQAYGLGTQVGVLLPFSRVQETEADRLGLIFMAMAGYDPRAAADFWQRMSAAKQGAAPPEFLSTHPADETRIRNIKEFLPEAMRYYRPR